MEKIGAGSFGSVLKKGNSVFKFAFSKSNIKLINNEWDIYRVIHGSAPSKLTERWIDGKKLLVKMKRLIKKMVQDMYGDWIEIVAIEMECAQCDLSDLYANFAPLSEKQCLFYVGSIGLGLSHLHQNKIIYRDLKLENVLVFNSGTIKLCDFGLSTFFKEKFPHGVNGTFNYIAPEAVDGVYDSRVDWFSLGVIAFFLLKGEYPFKCIDHNLDIKSIEYEIKNRKAYQSKSLFGATSDYKYLLAKLLKLKPERRIDSFTKFSQLYAFFQFDWESCLTNGPHAKIIPLMDGNPNVDYKLDVIKNKHKMSDYEHVYINRFFE
jgi:hypothetical protein